MLVLDNQDRQLLRLVQADAALSVGDLAERVALSKSACWRRLQKLEEAGVIRQRVTLLDPASVGLGLTVFITLRTNQHNADWAQRFNRIVQDVEGILEVYRLGGQLDYLLKAVVADMPGYDRLYQRLIEADLFDVSASFVMEEIKATTVLPLG
ncbi:MAG TPA: transcriptional regulator [Halieaceae bacterium]|jgi:Lrp/AsnC family transcriptional regulator|uniref:Transcriptional regulator n=1 Tax=Haliea salexigens TaxID=287487 RepID=A0A3C1KNP1_9GAMM|nr:Lrp/AsnC family transcriptional regulator [Haliea sp.]HAN28312.1 transcriptional regulator [Haliea salexigens]HAN69641.1 transcriptional regulator [Halieaceae bacterium]MAY93667.1 transcriptional regulator [Haliea sp.]MBK41426.1 transcriptional regulator [Haliea sp.]MBP68374.1 transcriptional regulator [Haliea sp.]|tara:strand:+ start:13056 stop:13514 length:459 start_codon:yes stop_codon:yes gene_type:complete